MVIPTTLVPSRMTGAQVTRLLSSSSQRPSQSRSHRSDRLPRRRKRNLLYNDFGQVTRHLRKNGYYEHFVYDSGNADPLRRRELLRLSIPVTSSGPPAEGAANTWTKFTYYTAADGDKSVWKYRVKQVFDPLGNETVYEYDKAFANGVQGNTPCYGRGLITKISYPNDPHDDSTGTSRSTTYDIYGNKKRKLTKLTNRVNVPITMTTCVLRTSRFLACLRRPIAMR